MNTEELCRLRPKKNTVKNGSHLLFGSIKVKDFKNWPMGPQFFFRKVTLNQSFYFENK